MGPPQNGVRPGPNQQPQGAQPNRPQGQGPPPNQKKGPQKPRRKLKPKLKFKPLEVKLRQVQIEGLVLLKIIKHSGEFVGKKQAVSGKLLGLPTNNYTVEVTNCFPEPASFFQTLSGDVHETVVTAETKRSQKYCRSMIDLMSRIREDNRVVGFYRSCIDGEFMSHGNIDAQYHHQMQSPASVCIVYDPTASVRGRLVIRAFHLTDAFMDFYAQNDFGMKAVAKSGMNSNDIFEELDIRIHNSHLVHAYLFDIAQFPPSRALTNKSSRLHHSHQEGLEMNLKQLTGAVDAYANYSDSFRRYYSASRRLQAKRDAFKENFMNENRSLRAQGRKPRPMPDLDSLFPEEEEPSRMDSVTCTAQMNEYCEEVETSIMQGLVKLWVTQGIHADKVIQ